MHQVITQEGERAGNNEVAALKPYLVYWGLARVYGEAAREQMDI